jgi:hypothetical protein
MRGLFEGSDLIATLPEVIEGTVRAPNSDWLETMFCPPDLGARVLDAVRSVRENAPRVDAVLPPFPPVE